MLPNQYRTVQYAFLYSEGNYSSLGRDDPKKGLRSCYHQQKAITCGLFQVLIYLGRQHTVLHYVQIQDVRNSERKPRATSLQGGKCIIMRHSGKSRCYDSSPLAHCPPSLSRWMVCAKVGLCPNVFSKRTSGRGVKHLCSPSLELSTDKPSSSFQRIPNLCYVAGEAVKHAMHNNNNNSSSSGTRSPP